MWNPEKPTDFSRFNAFDMPDFLQWWEARQVETMGASLAGAFVEGVAQPWLELIAEGSPMPQWVKSLLRWRLAAMWIYQQGIPLARKLERGIGGLIEAIPDTAPREFQFAPEDIAEVPPQIRQAFLEGNKFSMGWIKNLGDDARELTGDLLSIQTLRARNPQDAIPLLEQILRRELVAKEQGIPVSQVTPDMVGRWTGEASFKTLKAISHRSQMIARTEQMRMMDLGILTSMEEQGEQFCFVMPHAGSCPDCQRLIDGRVFRIETLKKNLFVNFGVKRSGWLPATPQHPQCRHSPGPAPWRFKKILRSIPVPDGGLVLRWYGLSSESAFNALELQRVPWLMPDGAIA